MIISEPSSEPISEKLSSLRSLMKREHIGAFIFPSTDPHHGEYVPDHWKGREWISGFDGSAGTAVVTMHSAALWTDSKVFSCGGRGTARDGLHSDETEGERYADNRKVAF